MSERLWVGTRKGLFELRLTHQVWSIDRVSFLGDHVTYVLPGTAQGHTFVALKHGHFGSKLHRCDSSGVWSEIAVPVYPPKPDDVPDVIDPNRKMPIPWSLDMIWSIEMGGDQKMWCGTLPGGLFTSTDLGENWELNMPLWSLPNRSSWFGGGYDLPGIHSICIDPVDPRRVTVAISCGGVWHTSNSGLTWECRANGMRAEYMPPDLAYNPDIQDPHRMVQCVSQPNHLWVQHHNGIFRSTDYGMNWSELVPDGPSRFGFAVAVHPKNPETAWFVPAVKDELRFPKDGKFVVTRTTDGGQTLDILSRGLPQQHAYHLVYRHALDVDSTGEQLAVGSTTGGLWISQDRGDTWQNISTDLPPIHCVRFQ